MASHNPPRHEMKFYIIVHDRKIDGLMVERGHRGMVMVQLLLSAAKDMHVEIHDSPRLEGMKYIK